MSEARFENVMEELRAAAPPAPERLRSLVRTLPNAQPQRALRLRPALSAAIAIAVAVGLGAALIGGFTGSPPEKSVASSTLSGSDRARGQMYSGQPVQKSAPGSALDLQAQAQALAPALGSGSRLQRHDVSMSLRVDDLSGATQTAVRQTRRLGGYVAAANYSTGEATGDSNLELRVPVQNVQKAIARFTDLGTLLAQRISVVDLQAGVDRIDRKLAAQRRVISTLEAKSVLTAAEGAQLDAAKRTVRRLTRGRTSLVREASFAKISLQLTSRQAAAKHVVPGRFDRFWGDAGDILGKEAIAVLYALVVAGPFALLALLALVGERARRRRADHRLLEETG